MSTSQPSAFYRFRIGAIEATAILDGILAVPMAFYGVNVPPEDVAAYLARYNLPGKIGPVALTNLLLDTGSHRILVDTGLGPYALPGGQPDGGQLPHTLAALGVAPESIDTVFLTHAHPDHIGGLTDGAGAPRYPNARHLLHQRDWDFWTGAAPADDPFTTFFFQVAAEQLIPMAERIERFSGEIVIAPGIRTVEAFGETPGHTGLLIESDGARLFSMGDNAAHFKIAFEQPEWLSGVNVEPIQARETKERLLTWVARERIKTFGDHHPFPGLGYVAHDSQSKRWVWSPES